MSGTPTVQERTMRVREAQTGVGARVTLSVAFTVPHYAVPRPPRLPHRADHGAASSRPSRGREFSVREERRANLGLSRWRSESV
jgi:hypothetical protein